jgi:hypothetical protein
MDAVLTVLNADPRKGLERMPPLSDSRRATSAKRVAFALAQPEIAAK